MRAFVSAVLVAAVLGKQMKLHLLAPGEGGNACLDGSPFGYYVQRNASSDDWVIDILGGGWCATAESCATRDPRLSSSTTWSPTSGGNGITEDDPIKNPDYFTYNHVIFPYCDGSSFTSYREAPVPSNSSKGIEMLHMRGQ